ncbi:MAG: metallophosphoesterase family protein [Chloroflexi bacterium]|nr:metallophosphoesterase family protein [Chloroflexota bacterium]
MRIAIFSDTHGNLPALEAVLADMRRQGAFDLTVMAGDLAMLGPRPAETVDLVRSLNCPVLTGNTDRYLVKGGSHPFIAWTVAQLGAKRIAYLSRLPFAYSVQPAPGRELLIFHATPRDLEDDLSPKRSDDELAARIAGTSADVLAFGHVHVAYRRTIGTQTLFDIASAGYPRDGDQRAAYGIAEWTRDGWTLAHRRVAYDIDLVAGDLRACGVPDGAQQAEMLLKAAY